MKRAYLLFCYAMTISMALVFLLMFFQAYPSGNITIYMNNYNEYIPEFILILIAFPGMMYILIKGADKEINESRIICESEQRGAEPIKPVVRA